MVRVIDLEYKDRASQQPSASKFQSQRRCKSQLKERTTIDKAAHKDLKHSFSKSKTLNLSSIHHTPSCPNRSIQDPLARKSDKRISSRLCHGDGDLWIEKECVNRTTGEHVSVFYSAHTGRKVPHEPPSGATKVLFMASHAIGICPGCYELYKHEKETYHTRSLSPIKKMKLM